MQERVDDGVSTGHELLYTSPLRLLLAIDGELSAMTKGALRQGVSSAQRLIGSGSDMAPAERHRRLQELRDDVQDILAEESARTAQS